MKMKTGQLNLSRLLPKTGQVVSYETGDDGDYQAGWWKGKTVADNKTRFIAQTIDEDVVVMDRATGLMWAADGKKTGCANQAIISWTGAFAHMNSVNEGDGFAGFKDWRIPNVMELQSILIRDVALGIVGMALIRQPPFSNTVTDAYISSTSAVEMTTDSFVVNFMSGLTFLVEKTNLSSYLRLVRGGV